MNTYKKFVLSSGKEKATLGWSNCELVLAHRDEEIIKFARVALPTPELAIARAFFEWKARELG
jgi:hypothetical protein